MRKKVGNEVKANTRSEREENISMLHKKAAALAWYKHGRKGSVVLGSGKGKIPSPFSHKLAMTPPLNARSSTGLSESYSEDTQPDIGNGMHVPISHGLPPLYHQATVLQASRFKAEAIGLQSSSSSSSSSVRSTSTVSLSSPHVAQPNKQQLINMTTGQSLALLSLLPHHQSQKCFNLSKNGYGGSNSSSNNGNNSSTATTAWDCGSSLYDSFELLCLSNQLGRCLTTVNAAAMGSPTISSSRILKNLASPAMQGPPLQPSYIPKSLYALPQFMIPNYLVKKASKKRSSLIHPVFSMPSSANGSSGAAPSLPAPPRSSPPRVNKSSPVAEDQTRRKPESSGFRRVFNSLLKGLNMKDEKPKRSNLSEELEKLPKHRRQEIRRSPSPLLHEGIGIVAANRSKPTSSFSSSGTAMASKRSPTSPSSPAEAAAAMASKRTPTTAQYYQQYHHHFRNEGFRTTSIRPPKSVKWAQPTAS